MKPQRWGQRLLRRKRGHGTQNDGHVTAVQELHVRNNHPPTHSYAVAACNQAGSSQAHTSSRSQTADGAADARGCSWQVHAHRRQARRRLSVGKPSRRWQWRRTRIVAWQWQSKLLGPAVWCLLPLLLGWRAVPLLLLLERSSASWWVRLFNELGVVLWLYCLFVLCMHGVHGCTEAVTCVVRTSAYL